MGWDREASRIPVKTALRCARATRFNSNGGMNLSNQTSMLASLQRRKLGVYSGLSRSAWDAAGHSIAFAGNRLPDSMLAFQKSRNHRLHDSAVPAVAGDLHGVRRYDGAYEPLRGATLPRSSIRSRPLRRFSSRDSAPEMKSLAWH